MYEFSLKKKNNNNEFSGSTAWVCWAELAIYKSITLRQSRLLRNGEGMKYEM